MQLIGGLPSSRNNTCIFTAGTDRYIPACLVLFHRFKALPTAN